MSTIIPEKDLATDLTPEQSVELAYSRELAEIASKVTRGLPSLIECDKELAPYLFLNLRARLRESNLRCIYLDGRPRETDQPGPMPVGLIGTMISQLREAVRGAVEKRVVVLPHLDLLTTSQGGLTAEAREVIPLLYENPELVWLGFKDPSFPLPKVIENLFPHRTSILGTSRNRLRYLVTQREARKFSRHFNPWALYKYVSGVNAVRLRRLLSTLEGEDYPADPKTAYRQIRQATLSGSLEIPEIKLDTDIGGYKKVKEQLRKEILDILSRRESATNEEEITAMEELIPRGMIFWGPPGTGKTFFAKAMAAELGAAITIVSGPELKSKWVGESEEQLRQVFHKARQSAPSIIVFDEIDSFASARGTYTGSGVEHSMVNQLLTEMDGFHKEELVFIVGTTNFVESLDPALLRPGRFEFHMHIPYPDDDDRRAILDIYNKKMRLKFTEDAMNYAVRRTGFTYRTAQGTPYSGDHLNALCRAVARIRLRDNRADDSSPEDIERGLTEYEEKLDLTPREERLLATHEAGHFICSIHCPNSPPVERITIKSEMSWAPAYVLHKDDQSRRLGTTRNQMLDDLCVLLGGIEAERLLIEDVSTGAGGSDLRRATSLAHAYVEIFGMEDDIGLRQYRSLDDGTRLSGLSERQLEMLDEKVTNLIRGAQVRARKILEDNKPSLILLRDQVIEKKTIEAKNLSDILAKVQPEGKKKPKKSSTAEDDTK